jgi:hypothetical protein
MLKQAVGCAVWGPIPACLGGPCKTAKHFTLTGLQAQAEALAIPDATQEYNLGYNNMYSSES